MVNPQNAIIAVTLQCNSHCIMCDLWKNKTVPRMNPRHYQLLPSSLRDINITGGEPFLRPDLPQIISQIKKTCPYSKIIINTNGLLPQQIFTQVTQILKIDSKIGVRVSLDGTPKNHNLSRGLSPAYQLAIQTLNLLSPIVKDLGVSFTIMNHNYPDILKIQRYCQRHHLEFSLTLVSDSPIYFGPKHQSLRPQDQTKLKKIFNRLHRQRLLQKHLKSWYRDWFEQQLLNFYLTQKRSLRCDAGKNFFYLDPSGNVYTCHLKNQKIGNLLQTPFSQLWSSSHFSNSSCQQCWQICTAKTAIRHNIIPISLAVIKTKLWPKSN